MKPLGVQAGGCSTLSRGAVRLYRLIERFEKRYHRPFHASQKWVAEQGLKVSIRSVKSWYRELIQGGYLSQHRRSQNTAVCSILRPFFAPQVAPQVESRDFAPQIAPQIAPRIYRTELPSEGTTAKLAGPLAEFSEEQTQHPRVQAALRRARHRIESAENPEAYTAAIIRGELQDLQICTVSQRAASAMPGMVCGEMPRQGVHTPLETAGNALAEEREVMPGGLPATSNPPKIPAQSDEWLHGFSANVQQLALSKTMNRKAL